MAGETEKRFDGRIVRVLSEAGFAPCDVEVDTASPLGGTNTSYICVNRRTGEKYILRLASKSSGVLGIDRKGEYDAIRAASELGCGAPLLYFDSDSGDMLTGYIEGRQLTPDDFTPDSAGAFAEIMKRLHSGRVGHRFDPFADVEKRLDAIRENKIPLRAGFDINYAFYRDIAERCRKTPEKFTGLCHNDPFAGNFIMKPDGKLTLVDFEFSGTGNIFFDFSCLISSWPDELRTDFWRAYFGDNNPEYDKILRDWDVINVMWNCTWAYLKSLDSGTSANYGGDAAFDFVGFGDRHVDILDSLRAARGG